MLSHVLTGLALIDGGHRVAVALLTQADLIEAIHLEDGILYALLSMKGQVKILSRLMK